MSKALLISSFLLVVLAFAAVWVFEPAIHYYESVNVNTMGSDDFTMTDRYAPCASLLIYHPHCYLFNFHVLGIAEILTMEAQQKLAYLL